MTTATTTVDIQALTRAIESRDADGVLAWYADDATLTLLDRDHPPAAPTVFDGHGPIGDYYRDICGRNIDHQVDEVIADGDRFSFVQRCRYPSGERVVCLTTAEVGADGLITSQLGVQVWDS